jgi:hypothetical protein
MYLLFEMHKAMVLVEFWTSLVTIFPASASGLPFKFKKLAFAFFSCRNQVYVYDLIGD